MNPGTMRRVAEPADRLGSRPAEAVRRPIKPDGKPHHENFSVADHVPFVPQASSLPFKAHAKLVDDSEGIPGRVIGDAAATRS